MRRLLKYLLILLVLPLFFTTTTSCASQRNTPQRGQHPTMQNSRRVMDCDCPPFDRRGRRVSNAHSRGRRWLRNSHEKTLRFTDEFNAVSSREIAWWSSCFTSKISYSLGFDGSEKSCVWRLSGSAKKRRILRRRNTGIPWMSWNIWKKSAIRLICTLWLIQVL